MQSTAVKPGYKVTELGVIPEDWEVHSLSKILKESPKYGVNAAAVSFNSKLPTYIRITDISEDGYFKPTEKVCVNHAQSDLYKVCNGDVLLTRTGASVGKSYLYRESDGELIYAGFLIKVSPDDSKLLSDYLFQYLKTSSYWSWVTVMSMRSGQPGINGNEYGQLLVPLPPLPEQKAIAAALSDVDALLTAQEALIAKKRDIKTATMQQLLTGKVRLGEFGQRAGATAGTSEAGVPPGYQQTELGVIPEDWEIKKIGDFCNCYSGGTPSTSVTSYYGGKIAWITSGDLNKNRIKTVSGRITDKGLQNSSAKMIKSYTLLFALYGATAGVSAISEIEAAINQAILAIIPNHDSDNEFIFQYLQLKKEYLIDTFTQGGQPNFSAEVVKSFLIFLPSLLEQKAIATVLSDMDTEITALEAQLNKTKAIKQGMMQELLIGKTRLLQT